MRPLIPTAIAARRVVRRDDRGVIARSLLQVLFIIVAPSASLDRPAGRRPVFIVTARAVPKEWLDPTEGCLRENEAGSPWRIRAARLAPPQCVIIPNASLF